MRHVLDALTADACSVCQTLEANIGLVTDTAVNRDFLPFVDAVLTDNERTTRLGQLVAAYEERVLHNGMSLAFKIPVHRDYSRPEMPRFLVTSDEGALTPEDYVCRHVARLGWTPALRTENDCWERLALIVSSLVTVRRIFRAPTRRNTDAARDDRAYLASHFGVPYCDLSPREHEAFERAIAAVLRDNEALRKTQRGCSVPEWSEPRRETYDAFFASLLPQFETRQLLGVLDIAYREGSLAGMPDITYVGDGAVGFIEVKAPRDSLHKRQAERHDYLRRVLGLDVWLCELEEIEPREWHSVGAFYQAREVARVTRAGVKQRVEARLGMAPGTLSTELRQTLDPHLGPCSSNELLSFLDDAATLNMSFGYPSRMRARAVREYVERYLHDDDSLWDNRPGTVTDTDLNPEFASFLDALLGEDFRPDDPFATERFLVDHYKARVLLNVGNRFRELSKLGKDQVGAVLPTLRVSLAFYVEAWRGSSHSIWRPEHMPSSDEIAFLNARHEFVSGERFPYRGCNYRLELVDEQDMPLTFKNGRFWLLHSEQRNGHQVFSDWFAQHTFPVFETFSPLANLLERLPSEIPQMVNTLTTVLERLGRYDEALAELDELEALALPGSSGPKSATVALQKRRVRLERRLSRRTADDSRSQISES